MGDPIVETAGATHVGQRRDHNEDAWACFRADNTGWLICVVADGMGGHLAGEVASAIAVETINREFSGGAHSDPATAPRQVIEMANAAIWAEAENDPEKSGMGSTVVCALIDNAQVWLANVGDSPAYLVSGGEARQVTRDHGWVAEQVESGLVAAEDAERHPFRHILTRCLGTEPEVNVEVYETLELGVGDTLVLCSDGLTEHVRVEEIGPIIVSAASLSQAGSALIALANERGGHDNITVVMASRRES